MLVWLFVGVLLGVIGVLTLRYIHYPKGTLQRWYRLLLNPTTISRTAAANDSVERIRTDYQAILVWQQTSTSLHASRQWREAALYLSGEYLHDYRVALQQNATADSPRCVGILRADHHIEIRDLSPDCRRCLLLDTQFDRRMATYDGHTGRRLHTQDLGSGVLIYQMVYDERHHRWKIDAFVQELQLGWQRYYATASSAEIQLTSLPPSTGCYN